MIDPETMSFVYDRSAFGLPSGFSVWRDYSPETDQVMFTARHQRFQYANFGMESFINDSQGERVATGVRKAASLLAASSVNELTAFLNEMGKR